MAFDRLEPNRDLILRLQAEGKTLTDIADELSRLKAIETTPASKRELATTAVPT